MIKVKQRPNGFTRRRQRTDIILVSLAFAILFVIAFLRNCVGM